MLLYIHIPFCDSKCHYCSFNSYVDKFYLKKDYMFALKKQLLHELDRFEVKKNSIESIFIGGGTPSTIPPKLYNDIFETINPFICNDIEITTEANPNSATKEWLFGMKELGVNRVSFGVQSFDEKKLKALNRAHTKDVAIKAINDAKEVGFENISIDLIYNFYKDTKELLKNDIDTAFTLPINHISAYSLTIEEGTKFYTTPSVAKDDVYLANFVIDYIVLKGFNHYEISNFGIYKSKHNLGYWKYKDYIGIGAGAVGKLKNKRFYPIKDIDEYIKNPLNIDIERLTQEDIDLEKVFLGFRSEVGVDEKLVDKQKAFLLVDEGKLIYKNKIFYNKDYLLADEITSFVSSDV